MQNHPFLMGRMAVPFACLWALTCQCLCLCVVTAAQAQPKSSAGELPPVTVSAKANRDPVQKSYRKMLRGMDLFEKQHALSPQWQFALQAAAAPARDRHEHGAD